MEWNNIVRRKGFRKMRYYKSLFNWIEGFKGKPNFLIETKIIGRKARQEDICFNLKNIDPVRTYINPINLYEIVKKGIEK